MENTFEASVAELLGRAIDARAGLVDDRHESAFRLFAGFYEGAPELAIDVYARTGVVHNYADPPEQGETLVALAIEVLQARLPWLRCIVVKPRNAATPEARRGAVAFGEAPDRIVREHGVRYALDVLFSRDAGFYVDTRNVRAWALENLAGKTVLNTFAYTGSLGVAAAAGGAARVVQTDASKTSLNVAKTSYTLNGIAIEKRDFVVGDFFAVMGRLKREDALFDCVFLDAPFFSTGAGGRIDLVGEGQRLINKVRPLVGDGGVLVAINNALFLSGEDYMRVLGEVCSDGYIEVERLLSVPEDVTGPVGTRVGGPPTDPAPFHHSTKIAVLRVRRKDGRRA